MNGIASGKLLTNSKLQNELDFLDSQFKAII